VRKIKLGFLGLGVVASGTLACLQRNREAIMRRLGCELELVRVAVRNLEAPREFSVPRDLLTRDPWEVVRDPEVDLVVELMGGTDPAKELILEAFRSGKSVVSANKEVLAKYGDELFAAVEATGAGFYFEGSVCGAIPIVRALKQSYAGDKVLELVGIVNGTTNYILTAMDEEGRSFEEALAEAQRLGYAEADPTDDIEGFDAQRKLAILADLAFATRVNLQDVFVEGIKGVQAKDLANARDFGYVLKLLAMGKATDEGLELRVHPALVEEKHPLAAVRGVHNAVFVRSEGMGEMMYYGPGAGSEPTGAIVAADILEAARNLIHEVRNATPCTCLYDLPVRPMEEISIAYYIRMVVEDRPGVLAQLADCFGRHSVSIKTVIQKAVNGSAAEIVWLTHPAKEADVQASLAELRRLPSCKSIPAALRVYG